jgi:predicted outer membrane repeat protein
MTGGYLMQNSADTNGGGIYTTGSGFTATLTQVSIMGNGAQTGGGFFLQSGTLKLSQSTLRGNTARLVGNGGAYKAGSNYVDGGGNSITDNIVMIP